MRTTWGFGLLVLAAPMAIAGCKDNPPPGCRIAESVPLAPTATTLTRNAVIQPAGSGFVLVGSEGDEVRWAPLAPDGTLGPESKLTLPQRTLRPEPWFATTMKSVPGDQLVVAFVAPKPGSAPGSTNQLVIGAITQSAGGPPSAPTVLADLPPGVDPKIIRLAMGPSRAGQHAALTWGFEGMDASPSLLLLKADAQPVGPAIAVRAGKGTTWTCLDVVPSRTDFGVTLHEPGGGAGVASTWRIFEMRDDGGRGPDVGIGLDIVPTGCATAAPTGQGYLVTYQDTHGTYFSNYDIPKSNVNSHILFGVQEFGGVARQPRVACVAPMGIELSVLLARDDGPEVWRFDSFGTPQGGALKLPSLSGQPALVSAVPGQNAFWASYLDQRPATSVGGTSDGNIMGNTRYLVRVDCPMAAAPVTVDAATADGWK